MSRLGGGNAGDIRSMMPKAIYDAYIDLRRAMQEESTFDVRLRELFRLKSAQLANCER